MCIDTWDWKYWVNIIKNKDLKKMWHVGKFPVVFDSSVIPVLFWLVLYYISSPYFCHFDQIFSYVCKYNAKCRQRCILRLVMCATHTYSPEPLSNIPIPCQHSSAKYPAKNAEYLLILWKYSHQSQSNGIFWRCP